MKNERGRPRKYLTVEAFEGWCRNDFAHLIKKVRFQDVKLTFLLISVGIILAMFALLLTLLFNVNL